MKFDLHLHTRESGSPPEHWLGELLGVHECYTQAEAALAEAVGKGLDGIAITNHDTAGDALRMAESHPGRVIPGCEYEAYAGRGRLVHVVVLGIDEDSHRELTREKRRGLERMTAVCRSGGLAHFLAHPAWEVGRTKRGIEPRDLTSWLEHFEVIETVNGNCPEENGIAAGLAELLDKRTVGGSDAHDIEQVGTVWTEAEAGSTAEFLEQVRTRGGHPGGRATTESGFTASTREVLGTFYRREFLRAVRAGSLARHIAGSSLEDVVRMVGEIIILPAWLVAPQAGTAAYFGSLRARALDLRERLVDHLMSRLVESVDEAGLPPEERSRRFLDGMKALEKAFGGDGLG